MEKQVILPEKKDWGDKISLMENGMLPDKDYIKLIESCGTAYFHKNPVTRFLFKRRLKKALGLFSKNKFKRFLDAGCGIGYFLPTLSPITDELVGIDFYEEGVRFAAALVHHRNLKNVKLMQGNILDLELPDDYFDGIVCLSVLEHITDLDKALGEIARVSTSDARVVLGYPMEEERGLFTFLEKIDYYTFSYRYSRIVEKDPHMREEAPGHVSGWRTIDKTLEKYFEVKKKSYLSLFPYAGRIYAFRLVTPKK